MGEKKAPKLRFDGFDQDWEQRKLREIAIYRRGSFPQPYGNKEWYDGENSMPFVQVVDVTDNLMLVESTKQKISKLAQPKSVYVETGKVVVTLQGSIGRVAITQYPAYVDRTLLIFESYKVKMDEYYFAYIIQQLFDFEKTRAPGGTIKTITKEALSDFTILFSTLKEQQKVGAFFKKLDDTIALHQRKLEQLKLLKQAFLQKMFVNQGNVPELRFADFSEEWEQRKLSELATMNARIGWQNLRTSEFLCYGDYMLITGTDFKDGAIDYSSIHYIEKERFEQDKKIQISNGSILITKDGTLGKVAYVEGLTMPATLNAGVFNVRIKEELAIDSKYMFHYLKAPFLLKFADQRSTGGTIKHLNQNVLVEFPIPLPSLEEQHKVVGLLSSFDNIIALHQKKLTSLRQLKQAFLQFMFI